MLSLVSTLIKIHEHVGLDQTWVKKLTDELPQFVWAADGHGVKTLCSHKYLEYTGAESVTAMNSSWQSFIHHDDRSAAAQRWFDSLRTGESYSAEYRLRRHDGVFRYFVAAALPIRDGSGKVLSWLGISKDVHQEKLAEQNRHRSAGLSSVRRLAASMAHELNNPLEGLTNALFLVRHDNSPDHRTREEYLKLAEQELERVNHVTAHSLRFHRQVGPPVMADVKTIVDAALSTYRPRLQTAAIAIDRQYQSETRIHCFHQDLLQAFEHLIRNALEAMPSGGKLTLRIKSALNSRKTDEVGVSIIVADTGSGIPAALRENLFEPFFSTKELKPGLGLWAAQQIVRNHGGHLKVRSRTGKVHHGTIFRVFLPIDRHPHRSSDRPSRQR